MPTFYNFRDNSQNLVSYSTYNASSWSNIFPANATLTTEISAPDGTNTAVRLTCSTSGSSLLRVSFPSFTPNGTDTYTTSFFVKLISGTTSTSSQLTTDLADGSPTGNYLPSLITNTWVRVSFSAVPTATEKTFIDLLSNNTNNYVLDFWAVQIEKKSSVGVYVATNGNVVPAGDGLTYSFDDIFVPADLFRDGNLFTWGTGTNGQLGNGVTTGNISTPVTTFAGGTNWKQVSGSGLHASAIKTDGTLWTWGVGTSGQLGNAVTTNVSTPVTTFAGGTNWKQVSAGGSHTAAIKTDGTLWTWGVGTSGQLGNAVTTIVSTPVTTFAGGTNWKQVSSGNAHTAAIKTDGTLWTWGYGSSGRLGNADITNRSTPVTTFAGGTNWKEVSTGSNHTAAIKTDGTLWTWGSGDFGGLGNADITNRSTPVTTFAGGTNWKQASAGSARTSAIKTDGTLWTWGSGDFAQLGTNDITNRSTPITTFAGGTNWKQVSSGLFYTAAIKTDGTLWTWGYGSSGQLGNADITNRSTPVTTFAGGTNWKQIATSNGTTLALTYDNPVL